jgi:hypothetical protein
MSKMTLDEYLATRRPKKVNSLYVHTDKKGALFETYGITPFTEMLTRKQVYEWTEQATAHLSREELITLTITAKILHQCNSIVFNALKWAMYSRDIPFETVDDQNSAAVQAPDSVGPDLPEEPNRV